jgi:hypothetical protein
MSELSAGYCQLREESTIWRTGGKVLELNAGIPDPERNSKYGSGSIGSKIRQKVCYNINENTSKNGFSLTFFFLLP